MTKTRVLAIALALAGCAAKETHEPTLVGQWIITSANNPDCGTSLQIFEDNTYEIDRLCGSADTGNIFVQAQMGRVQSAGSTIVFTPKRASCLDSDNSQVRAAYDFLDDGRLRVSFPDRALVFAPYNGPSDGGKAAAQASAVVQYGCFRSDGSFDPRPITDI